MAQQPVSLNANMNPPNGLLTTTALAVTNDKVTIDYPRLTGMQELVIYIVFAAGSAAGTVLVEAAHDGTYTGTWSVLSTVNWAAASRVHHVAITGCHLAVRVRVSSDITGGSVTIFGAAN